MTTLKFTFKWEEEDSMSYDDLMNLLMSVGAYDIEDEPAPEEPKTPKGQPKFKSKEIAPEHG